MSDAPEVLHNRKASVPDVSGGSASQGARPQPREGSGKQSLDKASDPYLDLKRLIRNQPVMPPAPSTESDPKKAIEAYRKTSIEEKNEPAARAWYSVAYIQHMKLSAHRDAEATLDGYVRRFAGGRELREELDAALWLRVRIRCTQVIDDRCRQAAYTYLHEVHDGAAAKVAEQITIAP
jgi:hypothetical protein